MKIPLTVCADSAFIFSVGRNERRIVSWFLVSLLVFDVADVMQRGFWVLLRGEILRNISICDQFLMWLIYLANRAETCSVHDAFAVGKYSATVGEKWSFLTRNVRVSQLKDFVVLWDLNVIVLSCFAPVWQVLLLK